MCDDAPPGFVIEYFLAIHGMLTHDIVIWEETDEDPDERSEQFLKIMTPVIPMKMERTNRYHLERTYGKGKLC